MTCAVALFPAMDALLKLLVERYPPMQVTTLRGSASLAVPAAADPVPRRLAGAQRRGAGTVNLGRRLSVRMLCAFIFAVERLSLADTYSIFMCAPLLIAAVGALAREHAVAGPMDRDRRRAGRRAGDAAADRRRWARSADCAAVLSAVCYAGARSRCGCRHAPRPRESLVWYFTLFLSIGAGLLARPAGDRSCSRTCR